ncbi:PilZ domain-containing protein [Thermodesulfobacteriota bacterium B35]
MNHKRKYSLSPEERRLHDRRPIRLAISFRCPTPAARSIQWHFGETRDAGMGGLQISCSDLSGLEAGAEVEVICMPAVDRYRQHERHPVQIRGRIIWLDRTAGRLGISYTEP